MCRELFSEANLQDIRKEARDLLSNLRRGDAAAIGRYHSLDPLAGTYLPSLSDAQYIIAREYGYASWRKLKERLGT